MNTKKERFKLISIFTLVCLSPLLQAQSDRPKPEKPSQTVLSGETPQGLSSSEWSSIQQQFKQAKYRPYSDKKGGFYSSNQAHGWQIHYAANGTTTLTPRNKPAKPYHLSMKLNAIGYQTLQSLDNPQAISQKDFNVTYQWNDNLQEWWINSDQQLEQWFVLQQKPKGKDKQQPLTLQMTLQSELKAELKRNTLTFTDEAGTSISYKKLKVWDAQGKTIPAQMQLAGNTLSLLVNDQQAQYPLTIDPSFTQEDYLKASITENKDRFGRSVAISGDTLVVGAYFEDSNSTGVNGDASNNLAENSGAVYVFTRSDSSWSQQAYIKASNTESGDYFGYSVAISGDTLVVGAYKEDAISGAAYVFIRTGESWNQQAYIKASNKGNRDQFARSVAISGDTLVVGAHSEDSDSTGVNDESNNSLNESGAAYVFTRAESLWSQTAYLKASNTGVGDQFGYAVAISGDTLVVGTRYEDSNSIGVDGDQDNNLAPHSGAAYIFTRSDSSWSQEAYLKASNTGLDDQFGRVVAISGNTLVVGVYNEESNSAGVNGDESNDSLEKAGAAYVFIRSPDSSWSQQAYLKASNTGDNDRFGQSIAISGDTLVVGAYYEDSTGTGVNGNENDDSAKKSGAAYVFSRSGSSWKQQAYLKASNTEKGDRFGRAVAISDDTLVMGADLEDSVGDDDGDNSVAGSGSAFVFSVIPPHILPNNQWHQISLPMDPKTKNTVANIFADDGLGIYKTDWVIYSYNGTNYVQHELTDPLSQGVGYWIMQSSGSDKTLEMPIGSATTPTTTTPAGCSSTNCFSIRLDTEAGAEKFNLLGYPYGKSQTFSDSRIHADSFACNDPSCEFADAEGDGIFYHQLWSYDGSSGYRDIKSADNLDPWLGYWGKTLNAADGTTPVLMIPEP